MRCAASSGIGSAALAIILYALGLLERDGAFILAGHAVLLLTLALGLLLAEAIWLGIQALI